MWVRIRKAHFAHLTGFGAVIAFGLAARGANVVINYTSDSSTSKAQSVADECQSKYAVKAVIAPADLSTIDVPQILIDITKSHFADENGNFQIDILVNNAGVVNPEPIKNLTAEAYNRALLLNARGPALLVHAAVPYLPKDRSGRIINISSIGAGLGGLYSTAYAGSKGALEAMT